MLKMFAKDEAIYKRLPEEQKAVFKSQLAIGRANADIMALLMHISKSHEDERLAEASYAADRARIKPKFEDWDNRYKELQARKDKLTKMNEDAAERSGELEVTLKTQHQVLSKVTKSLADASETCNHYIAEFKGRMADRDLVDKHLDLLTSRNADAMDALMSKMDKKMQEGGGCCPCHPRPDKTCGAKPTCAFCPQMDKANNSPTPYHPQVGRDVPEDDGTTLEGQAQANEPAEPVIVAQEASEVSAS